jgi:hypothetical protein
VFLWHIIMLVVLTFASRIAWLVYCGWVTKTQPKQAAAIISASGRHFPFKRLSWRWPRSSKGRK